jgi:molybdopterin-guanine dinucleotide biosynthesis protein A
MTGFSGLILAGGQGARLGGVDKGLLPFHDVPLVAHMVRVLRPYVAEIIISANRHPTEYQQFADLVVPDAEPGFAGPFAGVLAGLQAARHEWLLCVPCDMPRLDATVIERLCAVWRTQPGAVLAHDGYGVQPTLCILPRASYIALRSQFAAGERSLQRALHTLAPRYADCADCAAQLLNCNTPQDWPVG